MKFKSFKRIKICLMIKIKFLVLKSSFATIIADRITLFCEMGRIRIWICACDERIRMRIREAKKTYRSYESGSVCGHGSGTLLPTRVYKKNSSRYGSVARCRYLQNNMKLALNSKQHFTPVIFEHL